MQYSMQRISWTDCQKLNTFAYSQSALKGLLDLQKWTLYLSLCTSKIENETESCSAIKNHCDQCVMSLRLHWCLCCFIPMFDLDNRHDWTCLVKMGGVKFCHPLIGFILLTTKVSDLRTYMVPLLPIIVPECWNIKWMNNECIT